MARRLPVLFEDAHVVAVDKPAGLLSVPAPGTSGRTALGEVRAEVPGAEPVHRLDRDTSGVLLFAKTRAARGALEQAFAARAVKKTYLAVVRGAPRPARGEIRRPIQDLGKSARVTRAGAPALTRYRVVERLGPASLVEVEPVTGRLNQIRVHFAALGHPLVGERKYARGRESPIRFRRVALHAWRLSFPHPAGGGTVEVEAPLPPDLDGLLDELRRR